MYTAAKARVAEIRGFYVHLIIFVIINILLFAINIVQGGPLWFFWVLLFWGIGLCVHAFSVYGKNGIFGRDWEEKKIRQIMDNERKKN